MLFAYKATSQDGKDTEGTVDASSIDSAIASVQRRGLIIVSIDPVDQRNWLSKLNLARGVSKKEVVFLSRQFSTLFEAKVAALNAFRLLAAEAQNPALQDTLTQIADDVQDGMPISSALARHPDVFTPFYVSMIRAGEESGKLSETFTYLADYLERSYELITKTRNALTYPAFVISTFFVVMIIMLTVIIPKLTAILTETGAELPFYTKIVIGASDFLLGYGVYLLILAVMAGIAIWQYGKSSLGAQSLARLKLAVPYVGSLYKRIYLSRIADNLETMLSSGIAIVKSMEVTADVVGSDIYRDVLTVAADDIKNGSLISEAFGNHPEIPGIMVQMIKVGEETGKLGFVLQTLARFYKREVDAAVDTLVSLIEPAMIVLLGLGVGFLLLAVLGPIYSITSGIS